MEWSERCPTANSWRTAGYFLLFPPSVLALGRYGILRDTRRTSGVELSEFVCLSAGNSNGPGTINPANEEGEVGDSEWHVEWSKDTIHTVVVQLSLAP